MFFFSTGSCSSTVHPAFPLPALSDSNQEQMYQYDKTGHSRSYKTLSAWPN